MQYEGVEKLWSRWVIASIKMLSRDAQSFVLSVSPSITSDFIFNTIPHVSKMWSIQVSLIGSLSFHHGLCEDLIAVVKI